MATGSVFAFLQVAAARITCKKKLSYVRAI